ASPEIVSGRPSVARVVSPEPSGEPTGARGQGVPRMVRHRTEPSAGSTPRTATPPPVACAEKMASLPATWIGARAGLASSRVQAGAIVRGWAFRSKRPDRPEATQASRSDRARTKAGPDVWRSGAILAIAVRGTFPAPIEKAVSPPRSPRAQTT